jgi:hypothetical protein
MIIPGLPRLCEANLGALSAEVACPGYSRSDQPGGIVHFGIGAFHRAQMLTRAIGALLYPVR